MAKRQSGFTLLETIVTLVIVSLIVTVLMQALQQSLGLRTRLLRHERETRMATLQEQWFRDTVSGAVVDLPDGFGRMSGDAHSLQLATPSPLEGDGLQQVRWTLDEVQGGEALRYSQADDDAVTIVGPLRDATFSYLDGQGRWLDEWKPTATSLEVLPRMVRLQAQTDGGELVWLVPVYADPWQPARLRLEDDLGL